MGSNSNWHNTNCDKTQIVTNFQIVITQIVKISKCGTTQNMTKLNILQFNLGPNSKYGETLIVIKTNYVTNPNCENTK